MDRESMKMQRSKKELKDRPAFLVDDELKRVAKRFRSVIEKEEARDAQLAATQAFAR